MRIAILNNMVPFVWGGAEDLAVNLKQNLLQFGHEVEIVRIPFQWEPAEIIPSQMLIVKSLELQNVDKIIGFKFPAYLIDHEDKTLWLLHQYRQAYDMRDAGMTNLPDEPRANMIRDIIVNADNACFQKTKKIFTNSHITRDRLKRYNGFDAEILFPPVNNSELFSGGRDDGYIFAGGRINDTKRQYLLIQALAEVHKKTKTNLIIAGPPDRKGDEEKLKKMVSEYGLQDRVKLDIRYLSRLEYADYLNNSRAVAYLPFDEDSLGYVSMEGALAGKPVITVSDSGGLLSLVIEGKTGWVCEPNRQSLSRVFLDSVCSESSARQLGEGAQERWLSLGVNWENTVEKLLQ